MDVTNNSSDGLKPLNGIFAVLAIVGAVNWGLVGLFQFDLVKAILGEGALARTVYTLVGVAGVGLAFTLPARRKHLLAHSTHVEQRQSV